MAKKETALMREVRSEFDRFFNDGAWPALRWPSWFQRADDTVWNPEIDVFEKDNRLVTKIDLPGMKKEDVKVEVTDGHLAISGERTRESEEKGEAFYRREREYGSFYRAVPLPEGVTIDRVNATFANGVLEVSVPLPAKPAAKVRTVEIQEPGKAAKAA